MDMSTIGAIAVLLLAVSSGLIMKRRQEKDSE